MTDDVGAAAEPGSAHPAGRDLKRTSWFGPRVVGIGASAGGLQAFTEFLQHMPPDSGLAFVLVQHLDPQQHSYLPELLSAQTEMPVRQISGPTLVVANHVYLIPPNTALTIKQGELHLEPPTAAHGQRLPIDHFFRSLAVDQRLRAVGIVLSGTGTDGCEGLVAIKAHGGLTLVQTPASAAYPAMPQAAITRGVVDHILEIAAMPALLLAGGASAAAPLPVSPPADMLRVILALLQQATGHDFSHYKRTTLQRRIDRRMQLLHLPSLEVYLARLEQDRSEVELLFQDLLIGVTEFFRDSAAFEALAATVIPNLLRGREAGNPVRIWVPGCATGEEAYSIAMLLHEQCDRLNAPPSVQIFATDIDETALTIARRGRYDASIATYIAPDRLARFFLQEGQHYQVIKALRAQCLFSVHNLISDPPFGRMDLIACRNLLIYFDSDLQRRLTPVFHFALAPGGYLFLGAAEHATGATGTGELFRVIDGAQRIYQRKEWLARPLLDLPWARVGRAASRTDGANRRGVALGTGEIGAAIERILLRDYMPTAVVIDDQGSIVHLSGRTHPYLMVPTGAPTTNLLALAHPDLQMPLRAAIRAATQNRMPIVRENLTITTDNEHIQITLSIRPLAEPGLDAELLLVVLQAPYPPIPAVQADAAQDLLHAPTDVLAHELQRTRDTLEAIIREHQETNLDLTAANEELRALNEELQATNEELQTSKEEVQSINEELQTVNTELNRKIAELDRANADLANLFANAQIPAIFLSADGRIARFTPQATELFALIDSDLGRPLSDLRAHFHQGNLLPLITQVLQSFTPIEEVIHQPDQARWWNMHIRPYHTLAGSVDGVVITFADISTLKHAEAVLQNAHDELERRVNARTDELATANVALQAQMAEQARGEQVRQQLLQQLVTAQEEERRHIACELHDQLGQDLTALILGLKAIQDLLADGKPATERITQLQTMAIQISQAVRNLAVQLRPSVLDDLGLALALSNYVEQWSARAHIAVDLHTSGLDAANMPLAVEMTIYRLVQEALTNVLKHAHAAEVSIIVERNADQVRVIIEDDGVGFSIPATWETLVRAEQLGLIGMRDRVALLGGDLTIESAPGSGTTIFARIPLPTATPGESNDSNHNIPG